MCTHTVSYSQEIHFVDEHYATLLEALAYKGQFDNTAGCLRVLTAAAPIIAQLKPGSDRHINARILLNALRKFLSSCWESVERQRCINVLLISLYNMAIKSSLYALWEDKCHSHSCRDKEVSIKNLLKTIERLN